MPLEMCFSSLLNENIYIVHCHVKRKYKFFLHIFSFLYKPLSLFHHSCAFFLDPRGFFECLLHFIMRLSLVYCVS